MVVNEIRPLLEFDRVSRSFVTAGRTVTAVKEVSFSVERGQVLALLGPNGAGKTTCIKMAATLLVQSSGDVRVDGIDAANDPYEARKLLGLVLGGERGFYLRASALDNLNFFAELQGVRGARRNVAIREALERVGLADRATDRVETYSRGMRQRLHIARAIVAKPRVLLLDEPSIGLDPVSARELRELVTDLRDSGVAIVLTTHYMHEAEALADTITVIDRGAVIVEGDASAVAHAAGIGPISSARLARVDERLRARLLQLPEVMGVTYDSRGGTATIDVRWADTPNHSALNEVLQHEHLIGAVFDRRATLEESYLALVGANDAA
ncbi:ABC transporter ATP-binding protein [Leucobacter chinensis]|uniref:ABC transporter ATP-binding protein n=1 Tax=Leucobacter chinensis TaxID=2851010 RepID=UPI001C222934|nr:ABC transporter ATP-binding protein [Leucobacter chinensis]